MKSLLMKFAPVGTFTHLLKSVRFPYPQPMFIGNRLREFMEGLLQACPDAFGNIWFNQQPSAGISTRFFADVDIDQFYPDQLRRAIISEYNRILNNAFGDIKLEVFVSSAGKMHIISNLAIPAQMKDIDGNEITRTAFLKMVNRAVERSISALYPNFKVNKGVIDSASFCRAPFFIKIDSKGTVTKDFYIPLKWNAGKFRHDVSISALPWSTSDIIDCIVDFDICNISNCVQLEHIIKLTPELKECYFVKNTIAPLTQKKKYTVKTNKSITFSLATVKAAIEAFPVKRLSHYGSWILFTTAIKDASRAFKTCATEIYKCYEAKCALAPGFDRENNKQIWDSIEPNSAGFLSMIETLPLDCGLFGEISTESADQDMLRDLGRELESPYSKAERLCDDAVIIHQPFINDEVYGNFMDSTRGSLIVKSGMGTGKSHSLRDFLRVMDGADKPLSILIVSYRISIARDFAREYEKFGFVAYYDCAEKQIQANRLIVQVESLYRVVGTYDLVILDESEGICNQFSSCLSKHASESWNKFKTVMRESRKVMLIDAYAGEKSVNLLNETRTSHMPGIMSVRNTYKNRNDTKYQFMPNYNQWLTQLCSSVHAGCRIAIPCTSKKQARQIDFIIRDKEPSTKVLLITGDTQSSIKKDICDNIDKHLCDNEIEVFIYTSTIESGISIQNWKPDVIFAYFSSESANWQSGVQMLGRCRSFMDAREMMIHVDTVGKIQYDDDVFSEIDIMRYCKSLTQAGSDASVFERIHAYNRAFNEKSKTSFARLLMKALLTYSDHVEITREALPEVELIGAIAKRARIQIKKQYVDAVQTVDPELIVHMGNPDVEGEYDGAQVHGAKQRTQVCQMLGLDPFEDVIDERDIIALTKPGVYDNWCAQRDLSQIETDEDSVQAAEAVRAKMQTTLIADPVKFALESDKNMHSDKQITARAVLDTLFGGLPGDDLMGDSEHLRANYTISAIVFDGAIAGLAEYLPKLNRHAGRRGKNAVKDLAKTNKKTRLALLNSTLSSYGLRIITTRSRKGDTFALDFIQAFAR